MNLLNKLEIIKVPPLNAGKKIIESITEAIVILNLLYKQLKTPAEIAYSINFFFGMGKAIFFSKEQKER